MWCSLPTDSQSLHHTRFTQHLPSSDQDVSLFDLLQEGWHLIWIDCLSTMEFLCKVVAPVFKNKFWLTSLSLLCLHLRRMPISQAAQIMFETLHSVFFAHNTHIHYPDLPFSQCVDLFFDCLFVPYFKPCSYMIFIDIVSQYFGW